MSVVPNQVGASRFLGPGSNDLVLYLLVSLLRCGEKPMIGLAKAGFLLLDAHASSKTDRAANHTKSACMGHKKEESKSVLTETRVSVKSRQ